MLFSRSSSANMIQTIRVGIQGFRVESQGPWVPNVLIETDKHWKIMSALIVSILSFLGCLLQKVILH